MGLLALLLLWSAGLIICRPVCAAPLLPTAALILWHKRIKGTLSLYKWSWVYVIVQMTIFFCLPGPQALSWEPLSAKAPVISSDYTYLHIQNIRDFRHHTANDFDIRYSEAKFRLTDVIGVCYAETRPSPTSSECRPMLSFELRNGQHLVVAPEIRYPAQQSAPLREWYKGCGLLYVFCTEEDIFLRSTDVLKEQLRVFPLSITPQEAQGLLRSCIVLSGKSSSDNEVYHPLWERYASGMAGVLHAICPDIPQMVPFDRIYLPRTLYHAGIIRTHQGESFDKLCKRCTVGNSLVTPQHRNDYSDELRRRIGVSTEPTSSPDETPKEEAQAGLSSPGTSIIFSGNRFREDIPELRERSEVPYRQSEAAGRAAAIPEPGERLQADLRHRAKQQKKSQNQPQSSTF